MGEIRFIILYFVFLPFFANAQVAIAGNQVDLSSADEKIYTVAEHMPKFPGGEDALHNYIQSHVNYPSACKDSNIGGVVYVQFIVNTDGHVSNAQVMRSVHPLLDAEAISVVSNMPEWRAGEQNGEKVKVYYNVPVTFGSHTSEPVKDNSPTVAESFANNPSYQKVLDLLDRNNSKAALKQVNDLLHQNPKNGDLLLLRGIVHCFRKEQKESLKDMREAGLLGSHLNGTGALVDQYCKY